MMPRTAVILSILLAWIAAAWAQSPPPGDRPASSQPAAAPDSTESMDPPMVGDHWTYDVRDEITGELKNAVTHTVSDVTPTEIAVRVQNPAFGAAGVLIYDRSWNLKSSPDWSFSPSDGTGITTPLAVGSSWKFQNDFIRRRYGFTFKNVGTSKVVGTERVTTDAGTFEALKIETSINGRNANDATKRFEQTMTTWYVPSIDHWIKRTEKSAFNGRVQENVSWELVEYGRR